MSVTCHFCLSFNARTFWYDNIRRVHDKDEDEVEEVMLWRARQKKCLEPIEAQSHTSLTNHDFCWCVCSRKRALSHSLSAPASPYYLCVKLVVLFGQKRRQHSICREEERERVGNFLRIARTRYFLRFSINSFKSCSSSDNTSTNIWSSLLMLVCRWILSN